MAQSYEFGQIAEEKVVTFLQERKCEILARNWRFQKAEIDIIARSGPRLLIVEVKARTSDFLAPETAVNLKKMRLLVLAANEYILQHRLELEARFDIASVVKNKGEWEINYIKDAFQAHEVGSW